MSLPDELKLLAAACKALEVQEKRNEAMAKELLAQIKSAVPIKLLGEECLKEYADAVKQSKGLTSMRPSLVKALEAVGQVPTASAVKAAKAGLKTHGDEVEKQCAKDIKTDKDKAKQVKAFSDALIAVDRKLDKQETVG